MHDKGYVWWRSKQVFNCRKLKDERKTIDLETEKFSKVIGFSITSLEIKKILSSLGCSLKMSGKKIKVLPPTWRPDIKGRYRSYRGVNKN